MPCERVDFVHLYAQRKLILGQKLLQAPSDVIRICAIHYHVKILPYVRNSTCILVILVVIMLKNIANVVSNKFRDLCNVKQ